MRLSLGLQSNQLLPRTVERADLGDQYLGASMRIKQGALRFRSEQGMVGVLAMNICKPVTRGAQLGKCHTGAVDPRTAAPTGVDRAPQQHAALFCHEILLDEPSAQTPLLRQIELCHHISAFAITPHHAGLATPAQRQPQCAEQNGFACAGFTG